MLKGRSVLLLFRWGIFLLACAYIYVHLADTKSSFTLDRLLEILRTRRMLSVLLGVLLLMVVNWWIEAEKWRILVKQVQPIGRWRSFIATIAGTSVALISPNRTGEFIGRVLFLDPEHRIKGSVATMWGGVAQFIVTLIAGVVAMLLYGIFWQPVMMFTELILASVAIIAVAGAYFYMRPAVVERSILGWPFMKRYREHLAVLELYDVDQLLMVLLFSVIRYAVFSTQFVVMLVMLDDGIGPHEAAIAVPMIFLITSVIPTILITELGIRGGAAIAVLSPLGASDQPLLLATFCIWVINLLIPAIAGSFILLLAKIRLKTTMA
jgi:hypothetical protein